MLIKKQQFDGLRGFKVDEIADFNGLPVRVLRSVATTAILALYWSSSTLSTKVFVLALH